MHVIWRQSYIGSGPDLAERHEPRPTTPPSLISPGEIGTGEVRFWGAVFTFGMKPKDGP
jgi:hypothetical protein